MHKMSQSAQNIFRDSRENVPYYSQNIWLKIIHYTMLFELKFSGKTSEEKYAASLGTKAKQIFFLNICDYFKNMSKAQRFNFTYRAYSKRSR